MNLRTFIGILCSYRVERIESFEGQGAARQIRSTLFVLLPFLVKQLPGDVFLIIC